VFDENLNLIFIFVGEKILLNWIKIW